eukprot:scaffold267677_cov22-Tisochrysis_lutea.AAC.3
MMYGPQSFWLNQGALCCKSQHAGRHTPAAARQPAAGQPAARQPAARQSAAARQPAARQPAPRQPAAAKWPLVSVMGFGNAGFQFLSIKSMKLLV